MSTTSASTAHAPEALARADLCRLVAACYYEPDDVFTEDGLLDSLVAAAGRVDAGLERQALRLRDAFPEGDAGALPVDYARLFLGPPAALAKPYASVWAAPPEPGEDPVLALLDLYAQAGLEMDDGFHELPDHVAAELEFLYLLIHRAACASDAGDEVAREAADALRERFVARHLARWMPPFAHAVAGGAQTAFYRELARLTERLVAFEANRAS